MVDEQYIPISVLREYMPKLKDEDLKELGPVEYDQSKVPEVSKKYAENVRRKAYLPDMTESFARGVEYAGLIAREAVGISNETKGRQDTVETQFNSVQHELTDKDPISAPEIIAARVDTTGKTHETLKNRLDSNENKINNIENIKSWELNSKGREERGVVVFISDDARQADWDVLRPIFNSEGAPLNLAAIANKIGSGLHLSLEQLLQLQSEGHEIMSHSLDHDEVNRIPLATAEEAERQYRDSKKKLNSLGLKVNNYAVPFGDYRQRERLLSKKYYRASRTSDYGNNSGVNLSPIATHELKTLWLDETWGRTDFDFFKSHIDLAVEKNALLIISTHAEQVSQTSTQDVFRQVIKYAKQNSSVMRFNDALDIVGNLVEVGDYSYGIDNRQPKDGGHFVVGANGEVSNLNRAGKFNLSTSFHDFPFGENSYNLSFAELGAVSPTGGGGKLTNYKSQINPHSPLQAFNYQTFKGYNSDKVYIRHLQSSFEFSAWSIFLNKPIYVNYKYTATYTVPPKETYILTVDAYTFAETTPLIVNPKFGAGTGIIFSTHIGSDGKLRITLFNTTDSVQTYESKEWNITKFNL